MSLLIRTLIHWIKVPALLSYSTLIIYLKSHWRLGLQHLNLGGTQTFSPWHFTPTPKFMFFSQAKKHSFHPNSLKSLIPASTLKSKVQSEMKSLSRVRLFASPWTVAHQAPLSMEFSRQEYWSGLTFSSPGYLPNPGIEPRSPALKADSLPSEPLGKSYTFIYIQHIQHPLTRHKVLWDLKIWEVLKQCILILKKLLILFLPLLIKLEFNKCLLNAYERGFCRVFFESPFFPLKHLWSN